MPLRRLSISVTLTLSNQFTMHTFHSIIKYGILGRVTLPMVGIFSLYKRTSSELWQELNPESLVEVYLKIRDSACSMPVYTFINPLKTTLKLLYTKTQFIL